MNETPGRVRIGDLHLAGLPTLDVSIVQAGCRLIETACGDRRSKVDPPVCDETSIPTRAFPVAAVQDCRGIGEGRNAGLRQGEAEPNETGRRS